MILPDTSIWVAYLRPGSEEVTDELRSALDRHEVFTCGPVVAELVAGAPPRDRTTLLDTFRGLPWADLDREAWGSVGLLAAELRDRGETVPLTDVEIAVAAHTVGATLWTTDGDFARVTPLVDGLDVRLEARLPDPERVGFKRARAGKPAPAPARIHRYRGARI